ncbi:uncharacterized protein E0L32_003817 [Thyridium curvatum]|uniref:Uncharacterized protein n=1 Tax=Thyridium curvatum TaxID=1093900 RepID=A0A507BA85_9PEZI|nr:uncharacterized protein E0L32_003817 [Thyridium curvatum]TPX16523.1 hypothetical protein E0L32_003817 [Thyridium curvatum]
MADKSQCPASSGRNTTVGNPPAYASRPPSPAPTYHTIDPASHDMPREVTVNARDEKSRLKDPGQAEFTLVHRAAALGDLKTVRHLLDGGSDELEVPTQSGSTPLIGACESGSIDVVKLLLEHGADITRRNKLGNTPLGTAASRGDVEIVRLLLDVGAERNPQLNIGWTPLLQAARGGHHQVVEVLLQRGADPSAITFTGQTALHIAVLNGKLEVVKTLLQNGATVAPLDNKRRTPLNLAAQHGHKDIVKLLKSWS